MMKWRMLPIVDRSLLRSPNNSLFFSEILAERERERDDKLHESLIIQKKKIFQAIIDHKQGL